ncbi:retrotransposon protein, putative, ty1-copia subclass [Tanacetum coccineum]
MVRSMMSQTTLPKSFWDYALETAARILNMVPTKKVEKTPYEVWHGQAPKLSYLKVWGCEALVKRDTLTKPDKLEPRSIKYIFIGYPKETIGYSFYYPPENKVLVARNAEFLKNSLINQEASGSLEHLEIIQEEDTHPSIDTSLNHEEDDLEIDEPQSDIIPIRRSTRTRRPTDRMCLYIDAEEHELGDLGEPANYKAALLDPESDKWLNAMNVEMQSMKDNEVWDLVDLPPNGKTVGSKWLFKKKTDMDGAVHTYKARLVAKGYTQTPGIDYEETFSPVADIRAIRILIAITAFYDYEIWQMDVKTAFLNGYLSEEVYMEQPEGFVNPKYPNRVCKLKRSIYGLKQASRQWNKRFDDEIKKFGFSQNADEPCVYLKASGSNVTFLILYVDDILIMGNNIPMLQGVKSYLGRCFAMKDLGEAAYILGIKIYRDRSRRLIGLCQSAYIEKILKRYHMENSKRRSIPMQEKLRLSKSQGASTPAELKRMQNVPYASAVGSIMYDVRCTRPDVAFAQNITSRFQYNPELRVSCYTNAGYLTDADDLKSQTGYVFVLNGGVVDWKSAKQSIFATSSVEAEYIAAFDASREAVWVRKFIYGLGVVPTIEKPIIYGGEEELKVTGYFDASWQTYKDDSRSQSGWVFLLNGGGAVTWKSLKQDTLASSTCESEYIAACEASKEAIWMKNFIGDLGVVPIVQDPIEILCNNESAVALTKEPKDHEKSNHIERKYHAVQSKVEEGHVIVKHIRSEDNPADPFTKALAKSRHDEHARSIGLKDNIKF